MALKRPMDLDERMVEHHGTRNKQGGLDDPLIASLAGAVKLAREQADSLIHLETTVLADKTQTLEAGLLQVANSALRMSERVGVSLDTARGAVQSEIAKITQRTSAPPPPKDTLTAQLEGEVRARLTAMSDEERVDAVNAAIHEGNDVVVGAVLRAPAFLSGMSTARLEVARQKYRERHYAADMQRVAALKLALEATERSGKSFVALVTAASTAPAAQLAASNKARREEAYAAANEPAQGE